MSFRVSMIIFSVLCLLGCAGPTHQVSPEQMLSQVQKENNKNKMQEQLMVQAGQATFKGYTDYAVGPEDLLDVSLYGQDDLEREVRVNGQGEITMPLVGPVRVAGLSPRQIETKLGQMYQEGKFLVNPQVSVMIKEYRHQRVMLTGAVTQPGAYEVIGPRTLLEMLGKAGGLNEKAGDVVYIIRHQSAPEVVKSLKVRADQPFAPGSETLIIDLRRLLMGGDMKLNLPVKNGDVVYVPLAQSAYVLGAVKKPGKVPVKEDLTVAKALAMCEGLDPTFASNNAQLIRFGASGERVVVPIDINKVVFGDDPDIPLKENDIVFVQESSFRRFLYDFKSLMPGAIGASIPIPLIP